MSLKKILEKIYPQLSFHIYVQNYVLRAETSSYRTRVSIEVNKKFDFRTGHNWLGGVLSRKRALGMVRSKPTCRTPLLFTRLNVLQTILVDFELIH